MKREFCLLLLSFLFFATCFNYSQESEKCFTDLSEMEGEQLPGYLQPGWGQQRQVSVAVAYFDFPDGRFMLQGVERQPFTTEELANVPNHDAVGEIGLTHDIRRANQKNVL